MSTQPTHGITKLKKRYVRYRVAEITLLSTGVACIIFSLTKLWNDAGSVRILVGGLAGTFCFVFLIMKYNLLKLNSLDLVRFLNQQYPSLQQSADLLMIEDDELSTLEKIQKEKTIEQFSRLYPNIKLPHLLVRSSLLLALCVGLSFLFSSFLIPIDFSGNKKVRLKANPEPMKTPPSSVASFEIQITPPVYTTIRAYSSKNFELSFPESSNVRWQIEFKGRVRDAKIIFSNRDSSAFKKTGNVFILEKEFSQSGFYQLKWNDEHTTHWSDYYRIEILKDNAPKILIGGLSQFTRLIHTDRHEISVTAQLSDDYALTDAGIIATVSKGSGEGIKFREERLRFTTPQHISGKQVNAGTILNLKKLGLEPGDELYFYVEAFDNKSPQPNRSRTETYFIAVQDTTKNSTVDDSGLGVDLMPDYFRSQRQIIIDTEKLLKDKTRISKQQFNATSNELGFDQKTLRLKYGQFLGEEEDSGIATEVNTSHDEEKDQNVMKKFGHQHDKENEHNLVPDKKTEHNHKEEPHDPDKKEDPLAAFVHSHDNTEVATFFEQSIRAKLKAALTVMWDAELYLRLYQPEKSLPHQYTALKLLKEISNDSRIYVHRTGFDPPPLKEEKRLTADLSEVKGPTLLWVSEKENDLPEVRAALLLTEKLIQAPEITISPVVQRVFQRAGQEFSSIALEQPSLVHGLTLLKRLAENKATLADRKNELHQLRKILWLVLPQRPTSPSREASSANKLNQFFIQQLENSKHE